MSKSAPVKKIKHYEILSMLGKGGMGEVYLAQDTSLNRKVAVKFLPARLHTDELARERFLREARAAAALDHPFICKIYEAGEIDGTAYIVMEYVEGTTIKEKIEGHPLGLSEVLKVALEVAEALEVAHDKGIVHRDLKPSNLMCTPQGHVKVMDFGLAKHLTPQPGSGDATMSLMETLTNASLTGSGMIVGTLAYMSPEQAKGDLVDARSDIFSLGVILDEMATGRHPFDKGTPIETLTSVLRDDPPTVFVRPRTVIPALSRVLHRALAKDPAKRYQKIADFAADIKKLQVELAPRHWLGFKSKWAMAAALGLGSVMIAGLGLIFLRPKIIAPEKADSAPISVLISDFENRTGDPMFDGSLEQMFGIRLEGVPSIKVFDREEARTSIRQLDPASGGRLDRQGAVLVSRREGIHVVVSALIESISARDGGGIRVRVEALDSVTLDRISQAEQSIPSKTEVLKTADSLAESLGADLEKLPPGSAEAMAIETFSASSPEALRTYVRAQDFSTMGNDEEAIREYLKAIELDKNLGRAYAGLAVAYRNRGEIGEAKKYYETAMSYLNQMTEREKHRTRGGYYFINRNFKMAITEYGALMEKFPMDIAAHVNLPLAYFYARDMQRAFEEGKKSVDAHPEKVNPRYNFAWYAIGAGRFDVAEKELYEVLKMDPSLAEVHVCLALIRLNEGKSAEAVRKYRSIESMGEYAASLASIGRADVALYEGRLDEAAKVLEEGIQRDTESGLKALAAGKKTVLARTLLTQGKRDAALKIVDGIEMDGAAEGIIFSAALICLDAGLEARAGELGKRLADFLQPEPQAYAKLIEGEIHLLKKDLAGAVGLIHEAQALVDTWIGHLFLGRAYLEAGQFTEAHSEFETCLNRKGEAFSLFLDDLPSLRHLPQVYYYLGRSQEGLKIPAAAESYREFLRIKVLAAGDSMVEDAKRRLSR